MVAVGPEWYQSQDSSLQSKTCSQLDTVMESPGLDLCTSQTVCHYDTALQRVETSEPVLVLLKEARVRSKKTARL